MEGTKGKIRFAQILNTSFPRKHLWGFQTFSLWKWNSRTDGHGPYECCESQKKISFDSVILDPASAVAISKKNSCEDSYLFHWHKVFRTKSTQKWFQTESVLIIQKPGCKQAFSTLLTVGNECTSEVLSVNSWTIYKQITGDGVDSAK